MKHFVCEKKRVAIAMFLTNLFKHLRESSVESKSNLALQGLVGTFRNVPIMSSKEWKLLQKVDWRTLALCTVVRGNAGKFQTVVANVMATPEYECDTLAVQLEANAGPHARIPVRDVWTVIMPRQQLLDLVLADEDAGDGVELEIDTVKRRIEPYYNKFNDLLTHGRIEASDIEETLAVAESFVVLTGLPNRWGDFSMHTCTCVTFRRDASCHHATLLAMLCDRRVKVPERNVLKSLQPRRRRKLGEAEPPALRVIPPAKGYRVPKVILQCSA